MQVSVIVTPNFTNANLDSNFFFTNFELTGASTSGVRDSFFPSQLDGSGHVAAFSATGHSAAISGGDVVQQSFPAATYSVNGDGSGTMQFNLPFNVFQPNALLDGQPQTLYVSKSGNIFIAANPSGYDLTIGVKSITPPAGNASVSGRYWRAGLRVDTSGTSQSYVGSSTAIASGLSVISGRRVHSSAANSTAPTYTNVSDAPHYAVTSNGSVTLGSSTFGLGAGGGLMAGAGYNRATDFTGYEIQFLVAIPAVSGAGVFVNPQGVVNAASNVPAGDAISPGEFIAIYGSRLAPSTAVAPPPYPALLNGVSVTINSLPAPLYLVSATQINCLVPYAAAPAGTRTANIIVTSNGVVSNTVTVPIATTSPGVFSLNTTGTGDGAILHVDNSVVNSILPAKKGEIVQLFMAGLGAVTTPVADGQGAAAADTVNESVQVSVNGVAATVAYAGLSSLPGLYQINFTVPASVTGTGEMPIAITTPEALHNQVTIFVQ